MTKKELQNKYSTGYRFVPAAAEDYPGDPPERYWCEASLEELKLDQIKHMSEPPTKRCLDFEKAPYKICVPYPRTDEEFEWAVIEHLLRTVIIGKESELNSKDKIMFVI